MDRNEVNMVSPLNKDISIGLQTSNNLDLNVEQDYLSPNSHASASDSSLSSKSQPTIIEAIIKIGMEFDSDEHAYTFYNKYAGLVGFSVRKHWVNRSKIHGQVVSRKFTCSREGYRRTDKRDINVKKHRIETRTGCLAHMIVTRQSNGKYIVSHFEENHNHDNISTINAKRLQELSSRGTADVTEITVVDLDDNNSEMQSKLAFQFLGTRFGAPESIDYLALDCENNLRSGRTRDMNQGDAGRLLYYFQRQHFENPLFYYAIHVDTDDKVSNIFWADDNMVLDYDHFGDVVCLDTTYRTNNSFRPYVQFFGLNHHKEEVIFGAALLYDETVDSLKWLFQTFIDAMSGKKPKCIVTDIQEAEIVQAVHSVLPETKLCLCVWQMYQNTLKHLSQVTKDADSFAKDFRSCVFDHKDEADFVRAWEVMLEKFSLQQNEWLRWMFREKEKWASVYGINTFFLDKNGTHLVENLCNNLKTYLNPELDVLQFFKKFANMVNEHRYKELEASFNMRRCTPRLMANVILLKNASEIYTPKAFEVFQREYEKCLNVVVNKCSQNETFLEYKANVYGNPREYKVTFNAVNETVSCSCMKFDLVGILCCHGLKVLDHHNIKVLPARYILKRWTRDARTGSAMETRATNAVGENSTNLIEGRRYKDLCCNIIKISGRAAKSDQAYEFATKQLNEVMQGVERILKANCSEDANACESEPAEILLDKDGIEGQDVENMFVGTSEMENSVPRDGLLNIANEEIQNTNTNLAEGLYNHEENQLVQCIYQPPNLVVGQQQPQNMYSNMQHDIIIQESLVRSPFQVNIPTSGQLRHGMDLDVRIPQSSSFVDYKKHKFASTDNSILFSSR